MLKFLASAGYNELHYPKSKALFSNKALPTDENKLLDALDVLAVCLATGKLGDVVAVAWVDDCHLLIASNRARDENLTNHAKALTAALTGPGNRREVHNAVMPIVMSYCKENIIKRVKKLGESLRKLSEEQMLSLDCVQPSSSFPTAHIHTTLQHVETCLASRHSTVVDFEHEVRAVASAAHILLDTDLFRKLKNRMSVTNDEEWRTIERLFRHLKKIIQFSHGILSLVFYMQNECIKNIEISWCSGRVVADISPVPSAEDIIRVMSKSEKSIEGVGMDRVRQALSGFDKRWAEGKTMISLHAELQIICHVNEYRIFPVRNLCHNMEQESSPHAENAHRGQQTSLPVLLPLHRAI